MTTFASPLRCQANQSRLRRQAHQRLPSATRSSANIFDAADASHAALVSEGSLSNGAMQKLLPTRVIQGKLTVSQPGDEYEQEADRVADEVMQMPNFKQDVGGSLSETARDIRQAASVETREGKSRIDKVIYSPGQPLDRSLLGFFEPRFNFNLSNVRIHHDSEASQSAQILKAKAYTISNHIVFGRDQYDPSSTVGRHLLAHEITHVVQQTGRASKANTHVTDIQKSVPPTREGIRETPYLIQRARQTPPSPEQLQIFPAQCRPWGANVGVCKDRLGENLDRLEKMTAVAKIVNAQERPYPLSVSGALGAVDAIERLALYVKLRAVELQDGQRTFLDCLSGKIFPTTPE